MARTRSWRPSSGAYRWDRLRFDRRDHGFDYRLVRLRALVMFDTRLSTVGFVQYASAQELVAWNLRLRPPMRDLFTELPQRRVRSPGRSSRF